MSYQQINGVMMHYEVQGEGIPLIFIHPPVVPGGCFTEVVARLYKQYQTITVDLRGQGKSSKSATPVTYSVFADDIKQLMDHLQLDKAYLCGYSTGGSIVLEFLLRHPERALGGIVVCGMSEVHDFRLSILIRLGIVATKLKLMPLLSFGLSLTNSSGLSQFRNLYQETRGSDALNSEQYYRFSLHYDCTSRLGDIRQPVLLVYGKKDKVFHSYRNILHARLPNSEMVLIAKAGHRVPIQAPDTLSQLIAAFIQKHSEYISNTALVVLGES